MARESNQLYVESLPAAFEIFHFEIHMACYSFGCMISISVLSKFHLAYAICLVQTLQVLCAAHNHSS